MKSVSLVDAKAHLSDLVTRAAQGEIVTITRHGKPIAQIVPARAPRKKIEIARLQTVIARYSRGKPEDSAALLRRMRDKSRYSRLCVDTPVLVAALTDETATARSQRFLAAAEPAELAINARVITEFSSALSIKVRTGQLAPAQRNAGVLTEFTRLIGNSSTFCRFRSRRLQRRRGFVDQLAYGLRAGDALHLAVAIEHGAMLVSLDKRLVEAGTCARGLDAAAVAARGER